MRRPRGGQRLAVVDRAVPESRPARAGPRRRPLDRRAGRTALRRPFRRGADSRRRRQRLAERDARRGGHRARRGLARGGARRPAGPYLRCPPGVCREHAAASPGGGRVARGRARAAGAAHALPRPARARRGARPGLQVRPADGAPLRPRLSPGARRGRRRCRRPARRRALAGRDRRGLRLGLGRGAAVGGRARRARLPERRRARRGAPAPPRPRTPRRLCSRDQRGSRSPARLREGRDPDRRRGDALQPRRVPRARPRGDGVDLRDAAQGRRVARRREGRLAPRQPPRGDLAARRLRRDRRHRDRRSGARLAGPPERDPLDVPRDRQRARAARSRLRGLPWRQMFDLRYHVASLAAVFVALLLGIFVGVGLSGKGFVSDAERENLQAQIDALRAERDGAVGARGERGPAWRRARRLREDDLPASSLRGMLDGKTVGSRVRRVGRPGARERDPAVGGRRRRARRARPCAPGPARQRGGRRRAERRAGHAWARRRRQPRPPRPRAGAGARRRGAESRLRPPRAGDRRGAVGRGRTQRSTPSSSRGRPLRSRGRRSSSSRVSTAASPRRRCPAVGVEKSNARTSAIPVFHRRGLATVDGVDDAAGQVALVFLLAGARPGSYGVGNDATDGIIPDPPPLPVASKG